MTWPVWAIVGFVLLAAELVMPSGFALALIGAAALFTSALVGLGLAEPVWLPWMIFAVCGVIFLVLSRVVFGESLSTKRVPESRDELVGAEVIVSAAIAPGQNGHGELRGTTWQIRNETQHSLQPNSRVRVSRLEGLTLVIT